MKVGERITSARLAAGFSQLELARRAGTSQPAINRYERGVSTPSDRTLHRILSACNRERLPSEALRAHRDEVVEILRRHGAGKVFVFGSVARGEDDVDSDVDLLVDHLDPASYVWGVPKAAGELESLLGVRVDVGEVGSLRPRVGAQVADDARPL